MLSPNARKRVRLIEYSGGGFTRTANEQDAVRCLASVVLHVTVVVPTGKLMPLGGVQLVEKGDVPPLTVGVANVTTVEVAPSGTVAGSETGQEICGVVLVSGATVLP